MVAPWLQVVSQALADTVRLSSLSQAAAGLVAAGGGRAVQYAAAKFGKAWRGAQVATAHALAERKP